MVTAAERERTLSRIRSACLALPETSERLSHGAPTFFVRGKRAFERFFVPPYVGHRGWLGVRLDRGLDRVELAGICEDAWAQVAPPKLLDAVVARLHDPEKAVRQQSGGR